MNKFIPFSTSQKELGLRQCKDKCFVCISVYLDLTQLLQLSDCFIVSLMSNAIEHGKWVSETNIQCLEGGNHVKLISGAY